MELNQGHKYWFEKGRLSKKEAEEQQRKNNETVLNGLRFLKKTLEELKQDPVKNSDKIKHLEESINKIENK